MCDMSRALLEVIALDAADAVAAEEGGADRLEVVAGMDQDGLTPAVETLASIRAATALPLRVMVRAGAGFRTDPAEVESLRAAAQDLAAAGADGLVLGFLDADGDLDVAAMRAVSSAVVLPWTCHRAIDRARDRESAWRQLPVLPGLDTVLTAGSPDGVADGLSNLERHAATPAGAALILAGGGLQPDLVPALAALGITQFHVGTLTRRDLSWAAPVDASLVRAWRDAVDAAVS
jgi:copper homeostasis protein